MAKKGSKAQLESLLLRLKGSGVRMTTTRRAVLYALVAADGHHLDAQDLASAVHASRPDVHLSTIYRALESLESAGAVEHVHMGHGRAIYHLADEPHQHLVCDLCGSVVEVPDVVFDELAATLERAYGFAIHPHHFALLGRCHTCRLTRAEE
jgi:Fe2+ or Zn2+ uptake regulation protein